MSVIIAYTTDRYLLLDADLKQATEVVKWAKKYSRKWKLGSVLILKTSDSGQTDLAGKKLSNFLVIFGKALPWQEICQHIDNAYKDGVVGKKFVEMRYMGFISERVNRKSPTIRHPQIYGYIANGNHEGCFDYLRFWKWFRKTGEEENEEVQKSST